MSEANKALVKRWFEEVWNQGRRETIAEILAPTAVLDECGEKSVGPVVHAGEAPGTGRRRRVFSAETRRKMAVARKKWWTAKRGESR